MRFWDELKRRSVIRIGIAYLALAWLVVQVASIALPAFGFSRLGMQVLIVALAIAFPIVLACTWIYDLTPDGLQRTDSVPPEDRVAIRRGRRLDFVVIGVLALALITVVVDQYVIDSFSEARFDSIAVLPLINLSGEPGQEYFADGMTEALITNLSKISAIRVISRTSAMVYKNSPKTLPEIAADLGVSAVLAGSVALNGDRARITVQLADAASDDTVWADTYSQSLEDILTLQGNIAAEIANAISASLTPDEQDRIRFSTPINPAAYDAYLRGMQFFYTQTPEGLDRAQAFLEEALEHDEDFALAHVGLAMAWGARMQMGFVSAFEAGPPMSSHALIAQTLDDTLPESHYVLALINTWGTWDFAAAEPLFKRAIELEPSFADALAFYSHYLICLGRTQEALQYIESAVGLDPYNPLLKALYGVVLHHANRPDEATEQYDLALAVVPNLTLALDMRTLSLHASGRFDEAIATQRRRRELFGETEIVDALDDGYQSGGYEGAMLRVAEALARRSLETNSYGFEVATFYYAAGDREKTIEWLERAYEQRDPNVPYLRTPEVDAVRDDPRVQALTEQLGI